MARSHELNWSEIQSEYVTSKKPIGLRKLAKKYNVSYTSISEHSRKENWVELRNQHLADTLSDSIKKSGKKQSDEYAKLSVQYMEIARKFAKKVEASLDYIAEDDVESQRKVSATLRDLKEILSYKTDSETREQEARIKNLEAQIDKATGTQDITIKFESDVDQYSK